MPTHPDRARPSGELIERLQRRRLQLTMFQGAVFLMWQTSFFRITPKELDFVHSPDRVTVASYVIFAVLLLLFIARSGGMTWSREIREILNDETTRDHRRRAVEAGYWAAMVVAVGLFVAALFRPLQVFVALHVVLSAGVGFALLWFIVLERRAQSYG